MILELIFLSGQYGFRACPAQGCSSTVEICLGSCAPPA